jgi:hypothetical protein
MVRVTRPSSRICAFSENMSSIGIARMAAAIWSASSAGRALYAKYIPALRERAMLACLTPAERRQFERLLDKLAAHVPDWAPPTDV